MGDDGFLTKMYVELRLFNVVGDTTWCRGNVIAKREEVDERLVDLEIWGENQRGAISSKWHRYYPSTLQADHQLRPRSASFCNRHC